MGPVGIISVRLADFFSSCLICDGHATLLPIRIWTKYRRKRRRHMPNDCVQKCVMSMTATIQGKEYNGFERLNVMEVMNNLPIHNLRSYWKNKYMACLRPYSTLLMFWPPPRSWNISRTEFKLDIHLGQLQPTRPTVECSPKSEFPFQFSKELCALARDHLKI